MRSLPAAVVFDREQARDCGWSDSALSRAVRAGRLQRVRRGLLTACQDDPLAEVVAATRACRGSVLSHRSAALLLGLPVLHPPTRPELTVAPSGTGDVAAAHLHRAALPDRHIRVVDGVRVTAPDRTVVDIARSLPTAAAVVTADAALRTGLTDLPGIEAVLLDCWTWPGIRRASRSLALVDARAESPLESVSRFVRGWLRLPAPQLQVALHDPYGVFLGRGDFYWDEFGVLGEADGAVKYDDREERIREKRRQEALEDTGLVVVR